MRISRRKDGLRELVLEAMGSKHSCAVWEPPSVPGFSGLGSHFIKEAMQVFLVPLSLPWHFRELFYFRDTYWGAGHPQSEDFLGR